LTKGNQNKRDSRPADPRRRNTEKRKEEPFVKKTASSRDSRMKHQKPYVKPPIRKRPLKRSTKEGRLSTERKIKTNAFVENQLGHRNRRSEERRCAGQIKKKRRRLGDALNHGKKKSAKLKADAIVKGRYWKKKKKRLRREGG